MCGHKRWSRTLGEHKNRLFQPGVGTQVFNIKQKIILQASEQRGKRGIFESKKKQQDADHNYKRTLANGDDKIGVNEVNKAWNIIWEG